MPASDIAARQVPRLSAASRTYGWLLGCTALGVVGITLVGEFGSIVFLMMAFLVGLSGAIGHAVLNRTHFFGRCVFTTQVLLLTGIGIVIPALWLVATGALSEQPRDNARVLLFFFGPMVGISVAGAFGINWLDRKGLTIDSSDRGV